MAQRRNKPGKVIGQCYLCGETKPLCDAHLFPSALRKFVGNTAADPHFYQIDAMTGHAKLCYTLSFDPSILCAECDGELGKYDATLIDFVARWNQHPSRDGIAGSSYEPVSVPVDSRMLRQAVLICLFRHAISGRSRHFSMHPFLVAILTRIIVNGEAEEDDPFNVFIVGYYKHPIVTGRRAVDVSELGRPHPADDDHGFFIELFGMTIFIELLPSKVAAANHYVGSVQSDPKSATVYLTSVQYGTPTFTHMLQVIETGVALGIQVDDPPS